MNKLNMKVSISLFLVVLFSVCAPGLRAEKGKESQPPNLVVLLADDLGYGDLGCTGSLQIPTPNIDTLAKQGVFCSRAYVAAPMCAPSRMALLTGRFPKRYGITTNPNSKIDYLPESHYGLPQTEKCLPQYLAEFGYNSAVIGKWHLGHTEGYQPTDRGFDAWWGFLGGSRYYFPNRPEKKGLNPSKIVSNYTEETQVSYLTDDIARECIRFIRKQKEAGKPFFLYASFNAPHAPLEALPEDLERFKHIKSKNRRTYCAMVHALDRAMGRILTALDETGLARNTVVVFLSDNGGEPNIPTCNAPFKGEKRMHFEGGVRVPMIVRYPADSRIRPGSVCEQVISAVDVLPTMLAENGASIPENLDGMNMLPLLAAKENKVPRTLYWCTDYTSAILDGDEKYLLVPDRAPQLYNVVKDYQEMNDLYPQHMEKAAPLARKLGTYLTTTSASRFPDTISWSSGLMRQYDHARPAVQPGANK